MAIPTPPAIVSPAPLSGTEATFAFAFLEAIHEVENPKSLHTAGPFGELGNHQLIRDTWCRYTTLPFEPRYVCDPEIEEGVALKHFQWIRREFREHGIPETPFNYALAWNAGLRKAFFPETAGVSSLMYALRVENLMRTP